MGHAFGDIKILPCFLEVLLSRVYGYIDASFVEVTLYFVRILFVADLTGTLSHFQTDHDPRNPAYVATQGPLPHTVADFWQV
jgi:protein tyrosine phosphatase